MVFLHEVIISSEYYTQQDRLKQMQYVVSVFPEKCPVRINCITCVSTQSTDFKSRMPFLLVKTSRRRRADGFTAGSILSAFANKLSWTLTSEQETKTRLQPRENREPKRMSKLRSSFVQTSAAFALLFMDVWKVFL